MRSLIRLEALPVNGSISVGSIVETTKVPIAGVKCVWERVILAWVILGERNIRMGDDAPFRVHFGSYCHILSPDLSGCLSTYSSGSSFRRSVAKKTSS